MNLTILSVAFSLAVVSPDSVGGAEQILSKIDEGLVRNGHNSLVIACPGSKVAGTLIPTAELPRGFSDAAWITEHESIRKTIAYALARYPVDLVHMHGCDFANYIPRQNVPVLVTLHLPAHRYNSEALKKRAGNVYLHCVSRSQRQLFPADLDFLPDIENGIPEELLQRTRIRKREFVTSLGRICPEKGFHFALQAAKQAGIGMLLAGSVFPFKEHQQYFDEQIAPALDSHRRYIGPVGLRAKRHLLSSASCLIAPSVIPETSSLVAREALACGTPVIAFSQGALPELIEHGRTGFIVQHESDLPNAIRACRSLDPEECRRSAQKLLTCGKMVENYLETYRQILRAPCRISQVA